MFNFTRYTRLEKQAFLATCLFMLMFWVAVMTFDTSGFFSPLSYFIQAPEKSSIETYCMKPENKKRKYCIEMKVKKKEQWEDVTRSSGNNRSTAFSLGK